jgi:hypothetical protein
VFAVDHILTYRRAAADVRTLPIKGSDHKACRPRKPPM